MSDSSSTLYIPNDEKPQRRTPSKQVVKALQDLVLKYPPGQDSCEGGFYYGTVSIAFLLMAIGQYYADVELKSAYEDEPQAPISAWLIAYLEVVTKRFRRLESPDAEHCGISCSLLASLALTTAMTKNADTAKELCKEIGAALHKETSSNDWLNGRAGALYFLRLARASFSRIEDPETGELAPETSEDRSARKALNRAIEKVILGILDAPRPWRWHGKHYFGAAHGDAGIITQVILTEPNILIDPDFFPKPEPQDGAGPVMDYRTKLEVDLKLLLSYQEEDGNWPDYQPNGKTDVVEFSNGAPGIVSSLESILVFFEYNKELQGQIDTAIAKGQDLIRKQGLIKKEPCLAHGISGNALALEVEQFEHFLTYTSPDEVSRMRKDYDIELPANKHRSGLYTGAAGRIWAWAVADQEDQADRETDGHGVHSSRYLARRFLGYNDI